MNKSGHRPTRAGLQLGTGSISRRQAWGAAEGPDAPWGGGFGDRGDRQFRVTPVPLTSREARKDGRNKNEVEFTPGTASRDTETDEETMPLGGSRQRLCRRC